MTRNTNLRYLSTLYHLSSCNLDAVEPRRKALTEALDGLAGDAGREGLAELSGRASALARSLEREGEAARTADCGRRWTPVFRAIEADRQECERVGTELLGLLRGGDERWRPDWELFAEAREDYVRCTKLYATDFEEDLPKDPDLRLVDCVAREWRTPEMAPPYMRDLLAACSERSPRG